jgi:hypothetical protein
MHEMESLVDLIQWHFLSHKLIHHHFLVHVSLNQHGYTLLALPTLKYDCELNNEICQWQFSSPPKAVPFHVRPVTSWNGRVEIS